MLAGLTIASLIDSAQADGGDRLQGSDEMSGRNGTFTGAGKA
jgi:hypothetical protein